MTDQQLQRKLNKLAKLAQEVNKEAAARYPGTGRLFYESEGSFNVMDGDDDVHAGDRQDRVRFSSEGYCGMDCGAW